MGKQQRALKLRIYPNQQQTTQINKTIGSCRFLWNAMLSERIEVYNQLKDDNEALRSHKYKTEKEWKQEFEWLKEADSQALCQTRIDLENAFKGFFKSCKKQRNGVQLGFPKFKSKRKSKKTYRTPLIGNNIQIDFEKYKLRIPKFGWINFRHGSIKSCYEQGKIKNITISQTPTGKYFASILFEIEQKDFKEADILNPKTKGLDMSPSKFFIDDEGWSPEYPKPFRALEQRLVVLQRRHSKKQKGSNNKEEARLKVAKCFEKMNNVREDFLHKTSYKLIKENDVIVVEDLNIKGMLKNHTWAKSVADLGWNRFIQMLLYKALWNNKQILMADRWFASSKICSVCGWKNTGLKLSDRKWICLDCGTQHDRDINAARNLKQIAGIVSPEEPVDRRGYELDEAGIWQLCAKVV